MRAGELWEESDAFIRRLLERVRARPDVASAAVGSLVPLQVGGHTGTTVEVEGYAAGPEERIDVEYLFVSEDYFQTLGIRLAEGRSFREGDGPGSPPIVVVNRTMARRYWDAGEAPGGMVRLGGDNAFEVVGVVEDAVWRALGEEGRNIVYLPLRRHAGVGAGRFLTLAVRSSGPAENLLPELRSEFRALDPELSLSSLQTMEDQLRALLMPQRLGAILLTALGTLALVLATLGIWGVVGHSVRRRTREMGIRMALGADRRKVLSTVMRGMLVPVAVGLGAGLVVAYPLSRTLAGFLYGVSPADPTTYGAIAGSLAAVAALATWLPARRATRVDPREALRAE